MLFKASITPEILKSDEKLCEQLYIFLKEYVPIRLRYESRDEHEDCIQDTMLYLLDRYRMISPEALDGINIEKFFYNRANSYIGTTYQRKLKAYRNANKRLIDDLKMSKLTDEQEELNYINKPLLKSIIDSYGLPENDVAFLTNLAVMKLIAFGYHDNEQLKDSKPISENRFEVLKNISFAVVDSYLVEAAKEGGA